MSENRKTVTRINRLAWRLAKRAGMDYPAGTRFDLSRYPQMNAKWREACELYKTRKGIDGHAALVRHEAELRNPQNAPQLHIERRP